MPTKHDRELFAQGACHHLAEAIRDLKGWPVCAFWRAGDYDVHAFVRTPNGNYLDVEGEHPEEWFQAKWGPYTIREVPEGRDLYWNHRFDDDEAIVRARKLAPKLVKKVEMT